LEVDLVGDKESLEEVVLALSTITERLASGVKRLKVDRLCHRILQNKFGKK
jgi:hypothetical protein